MAKTKSTEEKTSKVKKETKGISFTRPTAANLVAPEPKPNLPKTMDALQFLRTAKNANDTQIAAHLDNALAECTKNEMVVLLEKVMIHLGDISRQHNILKEMGIISDKGGAQERATFRAIMRWWANKLPISFKKNIPLIAEYTLYENLMYYQNTTDRLKGNVLKTEILFPFPAEVHQYLAFQIRKGKDLNLIAKHLPKFNVSQKRVTKKTAKALRGQSSYQWTLPKGKAWVKINDKEVDLKLEKVTVNTGDKIVYPRNKQTATLNKQEMINGWITDFCKVMDWDIKTYNEFRKVQNTPEQLFSSKLVAKYTKDEFNNLLNGLTAGQRFRVAKMLVYKDTAGNLQAKPKWSELANWYIGWEKAQEVVAQDLRKAFESGDTEKTKELKKEFKVKATGKQTIDLLAELFKGNLNEMQINNTYQAMIENMDLIANVFPIIDGSGSMDNRVIHNGVQLTYRQIVYAMCIAFSTRNPELSLRNTYGWFSEIFAICGNSQYKNTAPNAFVKNDAEFIKKTATSQVLSETKTFTENLKSLAQSDPRKVESTNMFASVEYFVNLVQKGLMQVEALPNALLYLTDGENNRGKNPKEAIALANSIGWNPLLIAWCIQAVPASIASMKTIQNCLVVSGFSEGVLSQILRGIKMGAIDAQSELWAIYEDKRYSIIN